MLSAVPVVLVRGSTSASSCATSGKRATCTVHGECHSMCVQGPFLWFLVSLNDNGYTDVYSIQSNSWRNPHVKSSKSFNQEFKGYHSEAQTTDCFNITLSEFYSDHDSAPHISSSHPCPAFLLQGCCRSNRVKPVATIYTELQVGQRKSVTRVSRPKRPSQ